MASLIWLILIIFGVCSFSWLPFFIDALVVAIVIATNQKDNEKNLVKDLLCIAAVGVAGFAFYKFFFGLAISAWWILLSPVAVFAMMLFPGGFTIVNLLFKNLGLMNLPTWGFIVGIVLDVLFIVLLVAIIVEAVKNKKK